jgi:hypothetical protein
MPLRLEHNAVDKLLMTWPVGMPQRAEIQHWRGFQRGVLATMKSQQAVAKRSVGRRVTPLDAPFFYFDHGAQRQPGAA